jgi:hypothetical protein
MKIGDRVYTVGGSVEVDVKPGETAVVSRTFQAGTGHLTIKDAPAGSVIEINNRGVDSAKAVTAGIEVPSGIANVFVRAPSSQIWTGPVLVKPGLASEQSILDLTWRVPQRTISMKGNEAEWAGFLPFWDSAQNQVAFSGMPGTQIARGFMSRDDKFIYFRYDFADGAPSTNVPKAIKQLDYIQVIYARKTEIIAIVKFGHPVLGSNPGSSLGIHSTSGSWSGLGDGVLSVHIGENMMVVAVPIDKIKTYIKGAPADTKLLVVESTDPGNGRWPDNNATPIRAVDYGF